MNLQSIDAIPDIAMGWSQAKVEMTAGASILNKVMDVQSDILSTLLQGVDAGTRAM